MLNENIIALIKATAPVVAQHAEAITGQFYQRMFHANPEVKPFFNQTHQRSGEQPKALAGAICAYAANIDNLAALGPAVELIAQKHCSLDVQPEHYPIVGEHLLAAIQDVLGEAASHEILDAWKQAYGFLADVLIKREAEIYAEQAATKGGWNGYREFIVDRKIPESDRIISFYLKPKDGEPLPPFKPGQYITVKFDHSAPPTSPRNYSLSDRPGLDHYRISVKREPAPTVDTPAGLISNYLHDHVSEGETIQVGPPCGDFFLNIDRTDDRPLVLLSGGVGLTPLLAMLNTVAARGSQRSTFFIHGARNGNAHALGDEVRKLAAEHANIQAHFCYNEPTPEDVDQGNCDSVGLITISLLKKLLPGNDCEFYFCGPIPFMASIYYDLKTWGVPEDQIHFEFFGPRQVLAVPSGTVTVANDSAAA